MGKFNGTKTPVQPTVVNQMGEKAYALEDKEVLLATVMTTFLQGAYYESETEETKKIMGLLEKVDPLFSAKLAIYARTEGNMRSVTHLIAAYIAKFVSGTEWAKRFYNKIVIRPDDMAEILGCYQHLNKLDSLKKISNPIKKGFKTALERLDAYQIDKYRMANREISLIDLVNMFHPSRSIQKNAEAYRRLMNGEKLDDLYQSDILSKKMSEAGRKAKTQEEKEDLKHDAIEAVIDNIKGMPTLNLLRNLRNIILYAPDKIEDVCAQLRIEDKILKSRALPFRFATAYSEVEKMSYSDTTSKDKSTITFESEKVGKKYSNEREFNAKKAQILDAIEDAIQISCKNIPKLDGNVAILIDHSGSVRGDGGGHSRVSAFSCVTRAMIGNLFASMVAYNQDNVYIGLFGDKLIQAPIDRKKRLLDFNNESYRLGANCGGGTEQGIYDFFREAVRTKKKVDNVVVFSDCQIGSNGSTSWYGTTSGERSSTFQDLLKEFKKLNPLCNVIVVNINQTKGDSVFHKSQRILNIAGWSTSIFQVITSNCKGYEALIKEIEAIEI